MVLLVRIFRLNGENVWRSHPFFPFLLSHFFFLKGIANYNLVNKFFTVSLVMTSFLIKVSFCFVFFKLSFIGFK